MSNVNNIFSPALFFILLVCFFLPFFNITCQGQKITSVTGFELIKGTTISPQDLYNQDSRQETISPEPLAVISFVLAAAGFVLGFFRKAVLALASLSAVGAVCLLLLSSKISGDITGRIELEGLTTEWAVGMYISFIIFAGASLLNFYVTYENRYNTIDLDQYTERMKICPSCGMGNERNNVYCNKCGNMLA